MKTYHKKTAGATIIGGPDGPTSVFLCGRGRDKNPLRRLKWNLRNWKDAGKRKAAERRIKAGAHTMEETVRYMMEKYHAVEEGDTYPHYQERRQGMKYSLIQQRQPQLLGKIEPVHPPRDLSDPQEAARWLQEVEAQTEELQARVRAVPEEDFPMEYHLYTIDLGEDGMLEMETDPLHEQFSCSYAGKKEVLERVQQDLYLYYGVSQEDIDRKTERYRMLVLVLSS